jgi:hypothetical protein
VNVMLEARTCSKSNAVTEVAEVVEVVVTAVAEVAEVVEVVVTAVAEVAEVVEVAVTAVAEVAAAVEVARAASGNEAAVEVHVCGPSVIALAHDCDLDCWLILHPMLGNGDNIDACVIASVYACPDTVGDRNPPVL